MKFIKWLGFFLGSALSLFISFLTVVLIFVFAVRGYHDAYAYFNKENAESREVTIEIKPNASLKEVGQVLEENHLIKSTFFFQVESTIFGGKKNYAGGTYVLNTNMDANTIRSILSQSSDTPSNNIKVTLREGLTTKDIAEILESKGIVSKEDFINACNNEPFDYFFLKDLPERPDRLEGYLFPDTYFFVANMPPRLVIDKMLQRFAEIYTDAYTIQATELGFTSDQIVTIASMIEKETSLSEERTKLSSLIDNRLQQKMNLELSSTISYVLEKRVDKLTAEDMKTPSPYNTFVNLGLPLGPIANPGEASIKAALYPEDTDYLYFASKAASTGEHYFANDLEALNAAKNQQ